MDKTNQALVALRENAPYLYTHSQVAQAVATALDQLVSDVQAMQTANAPALAPETATAPQNTV